MKTCSVEGCNNKICAKGLCNKHYKQNKKFGYIPKRTIADSNEIILYETYAEIVLYNRYCEEVARTLIDLEDVNKCKDIKWFMDSKGYVVNTTIRQLHRYIMDCPDYMVVDHINHNTLDNRKCNLRICTIKQNNMNLKTKSNSITKIKGINIDNNRKKKYRVRLQINNNTISKYFYNMIDAIRYRISLDIYYHKEFCCYYQLLEFVLQNNLEYTLDDLFNAQSLEQVQEYINNLFTDSLLNELGLLK